MTLPNAGQAVVPLQKLQDYCLSPDHPVGKSKARVFYSALGISATDAEHLRSLILQQVPLHSCLVGEEDEFGKRHLVDLPLEINNRRAVVRTAWIIRKGEDRPYLTNCYVK